MNQSGKNNPNYKHGKTIENRCKRCKCLIDYRAIHCVKCKNIVISNPFKGKTHTKKTKKIIGIKSSKKFTTEYIEKYYRSKCRGKKKKDINGYISIKDYDHPNKNSHNDILEHIKIMSDHLGRPIKKGEIIHHIDMDITNNNIKNLYLTNKSNHIKLHASINKLIKKLIKKLLNKGKIVFKNGEYVLLEAMSKW